LNWEVKGRFITGKMKFMQNQLTLFSNVIIKSIKQNKATVSNTEQRVNGVSEGEKIPLDQKLDYACSIYGIGKKCK